ncbi:MULTISPECIES: MurT ligase domain-containing protein [unclassified Streptomyces]|uniref:MurT ligase domain-containing protein n=1 Tax=unclassified Streptomyces TaxID=2593676 RepID=UPI0029ADC20C|nr:MULTISPECIES: MurT ligase domain-containing protein [unclassified Streptomyces]MDX3767888.1 MurT ligase domain-containing protein [Streptomyces sp. AK08-01B]MDX3818115.1 MurT ligase domain-containing protein [Streptomyces sp. AK08-01A]
MIRSIRNYCAVLAARLVAVVYRWSGRRGGTFKAGAVALRISPDVLRIVSSPLDISLVSGTNGKTTTTRLIAEALSAVGRVVSNDLGANLPAGIVTSLVGAAPDAAFGVMEVDERYLPRVVEETRPRTIVLLNLSRDQLDRTPECRLIADMWRRSLADTKATVVANADDPLVVWACSAAHDVVWTSVGQRWTDDSWYCPACGEELERTGGRSWHCVRCDFARPKARWSLQGTTAVDATAGSIHGLRLALPGHANRANAVMAIAAAQVHGIPPQAAMARMSKVNGVAGRFQDFPYQGHRIRLLLAKNPASWLETMELIEGSPQVLFSFNARELDGLDTSWLWDVDFSGLRSRSVFVMGERRYDMAVRLHYDKVPFTMVDNLGEACSLSDCDQMDIVANYTAFLSAINTVRVAQR